MLVDAKQAVQKARDQLIALLGEVPALRLEEVDKKPDGDWIVTLSYISGDTTIGSLFGPTGGRAYKVLRLDQDGNFISMKLREPHSIDV